MRAGNRGRPVCLSEGRLDQHVGDGVGGDGLDQPVLNDHLVVVVAHRGRGGGGFVPQRGLHDRGRHRPVERNPPGRPFGRAVGQPIEDGVLHARDGRHHETLDVLSGAGADDVARGGREHVRNGGPAIGRHRIGNVDHDTDFPECPGQTSPGDDVHAACATELDHGTSRALSLATTREPARPVAPVKGAVEGIKGKVEEVGGTVAGRDDLVEEGRAQQDKADAQRDAGKKEAEAESARAGAKAAEQRQKEDQ